MHHRFNFLVSQIMSVTSILNEIELNLLFCEKNPVVVVLACKMVACEHRHISGWRLSLLFFGKDKRQPEMSAFALARWRPNTKMCTHAPKIHLRCTRIGFKSKVALQRFGVTIKLTAYQLLVFIFDLSYHPGRQGESMCKWNSSVQINPWQVVDLSSNIFLAPSSLGKSLIYCICNF